MNVTGIAFKKGGRPMKLKQRGNSRGRLERYVGLFLLFGVFDDDREAFGRLGMKAFGAPRGFSARLARAGRCAKLG
jgi:hypothetical protein